MRVLYSGGTICSFQTLQRLVLLADEIAFMDRPSVMVGDFGTIGHDSEFRRFKIEETPVKFSIFSPPTGPRKDLYLRYIEADLNNSQFIRMVIDGLRSDATFQRRLVQLEANYGWGTGRQVLDALLQDQTLYDGTYESPTKPKLLFVPDTPEGRRQTLSTFLVEASIHVTNALIVAEQTQMSPISDDNYFCQLLALRSSEPKYVSQAVPVASILGLAIAKSVLPDEAISRLTMPDLFKYRESAKDTYRAWSVEIDRLSQRLLEVPPDRISTEAAKIIVTDVRPRLLELRNEMASVRDNLFGDLVKTVAKWEVPTISLAYIVGLSVPTAMAAFASALAPAIPAVVDYFVKRRDLVRRNSLAYLIGLSNILDDERSK